jgi:hypothetical protein
VEEALLLLAMQRVVGGVEVQHQLLGHTLEAGNELLDEQAVPTKRFLAQFDARTLGPELRLGGDIHGIAGSSLSSRAVTTGVRRSLALYEVLVRGNVDAVALRPQPRSAPAGGR